MTSAAVSPSPAAATPALLLRGLRVETAEGKPIVEDVGLELMPGEILGIAGESGSGKTTMARALLGFVQGRARITAGRLEIAGATVTIDDPEAARRVRGRRIAYVPQHPAAAMNPTMRIEDIIAEITVGHRRPRPSPAAIADVLEAVGLPTTREFRRRYPHQLSGGQIQRVAIAVVLIARPSVIVLDEPTTGLDAASRALVLRELKRLRDRFGLSLICISHDLAVLADIADGLAVMHRGRIVEAGPVDRVLRRPSHAYTRRLLAAIPDPGNPKEAFPALRSPVLEVAQLTIEHRVDGRLRRVVDDVTLSLDRGRCLAVVGMSGSGKTTIARAIVGLQKTASGRIALGGAVLPSRVQDRTAEQRRRIQLVPQDSLDALNPRHTVAETLIRPLRFLHGLRGTEAEVEIRRLLDLVRLDPAVADRYPATLSGGERQRVSIARALAAHPEIIVCDEITSSLDVSVQAAILGLLDELRRATAVSLLFITHDLGVVAAIADDVLVLQGGKVAEFGPAAQVLKHPSSEHARHLLAAASHLSSALPISMPATRAAPDSLDLIGDRKPLEAGGYAGLAAPLAPS